MRYIVTGKQMKAIDKDTIERIGIPSLVLMERAALAVADAVCVLAPDKKEIRIAAVCGTGNNGADGIAAGRILWGRGYEVTIFLSGDPDKGTEEFKLQRQIARRLGILMEPAERFSSWKGQIIVDAVFGIGLGRNVEGKYRELIEEMGKRRAADVVAGDISSGIHADTGAVMGAAVRASVTVTFGYAKSGLLLYPGREYAGNIKVVDIGFSCCSLERAGWVARMLERTDVDGFFKRSPDSNKGTFGRLLVIAGSAGMCGAAYLSGLAAYRMGCGLVKLWTVPENRVILQTQLPEAIVEVFDLASGLEEEQRREYLWEEIRRQCAWASAVVIGPGLGQENYVEMLVEAVLDSARVPVVMDADGLNAVSRRPELTRYFPEKEVINPHMGEMSRLTKRTIDDLKGDRIKAAREYGAKTGAVCVLKDASTVTASPDGTVYINNSGCSAMAKAGSGDVLAGVIGGLLAQGMERLKAAAYGVYIHGLSGEQAAVRMGEGGVLARELAAELGKCFDNEERS